MHTISDNNKEVLQAAPQDLRDLRETNGYKALFGNFLLKNNEKKNFSALDNGQAQHDVPGPWGRAVTLASNKILVGANLGLSPALGAKMDEILASVFAPLATKRAFEYEGKEVQPEEGYEFIMNLFATILERNNILSLNPHEPNELEELTQQLNDLIDELLGPAFENLYRLMSAPIKFYILKECLSLCTAHYNMKAKAEGTALNAHNGLSKYIDDAFDNIHSPKKDDLLVDNEDAPKEFKLPFEINFLGDAATEKLLTDTLAKIYSGDILESDAKLLNDMRKSVGDKMKVAIKAVLATVLEPTTEKQTGKERCFELVESIIKRYILNIGTASKRADEVDCASQDELITLLQHLIEDYTQSQKAYGFIINSGKLSDEDWDKEVKKFLKGIIFNELSIKILGEDFSIENFADFFPNFMPAKNILPLLYNAFADILSTMYTLNQKGQLAEEFFKNNNLGKLTDFLDTTISGQIAYMEQKGVDTGHAFANDLATHILKKRKPADATDAQPVAFSAESASFKKYMGETIKNALLTVLHETIRRNTPPGTSPEKAFSTLIEKLIISGNNGMSQIEKKLKEAAEKLDDPIALQKMKEDLLKELGTSLLEQLLPKEFLKSLLPEWLANFVYSYLADSVITPYLTGFFDIKGATLSAPDEADVEVKNPHRFDGMDPQSESILKGLATSISNSLGITLADMNFKKLLTTPETKEKGFDFSFVDKLIGDTLKQNGVASNLIKTIVPVVMESILAFHLNPIDGMTTEERAAHLLWNITEKVQKAYQLLELTELSLTSLPVSLLSKDYFKDITEVQLKAYCEAKDIPFEQPASNQTLMDCLIWIETNKIYENSVKELLDLIIPNEMWNERIPPQWSKLITRAQIGNFLMGYIRDGYDDTITIKKAAKERSTYVRKNSDNIESEVDQLVSNQIDAALSKGLEPAKDDTPMTTFGKSILKLLIAKEKSAGHPYITDTIKTTASALIGKLLKPGLIEKVAPKEASKEVQPDNKKKADKKEAPLFEKVDDFLPTLLKNMDLINHIESGSEIDVFPQIDLKAVKKYLIASGFARHKNEKFTDISPKFTTDEANKVAIEITLTDSVTGVERKVAVPADQYICWDMCLNLLNNLISDNDWIIPKIVGSAASKEAIASTIATEIVNLLPVQGALWEKAKRGKRLVEMVDSEALRLQKLHYLDLNTDFSPRAAKKGSSRLEALDVQPLGKKAYSDLKDYVNEMIIDNTNATLVWMGNAPGMLGADKLQDHIIKTILKTSSAKNIKGLRETLVTNVVHTIFNEVLVPATVGKNGISANDRSAKNIHKKLKLILTEYQKEGATPQSVMKALFDEFLPEATWNEIFAGQYKDEDFALRKSLIDMLSTSEAGDSYMESVFASIENLKDLEKESIERLAKLDQEEGGGDPIGGGIDSIIKMTCKTVDSIIDYMAIYPGKNIYMPIVFENTFKELLKDKETCQLIKNLGHMLVNIVVGNMFKGEDGLSREQIVLNLAADLMEVFNSANPEETAAAWLEKFLPEEQLKAILPNFLHTALPHKYLASILVKVYAEQMGVVVHNTKVELDDDATLAAGLVKTILTGYKNPEDSTQSLTRYGGLVTPIEAGLFKALAGDHSNNDKLAPVGKNLEALINANVRKFLKNASEKDLLSKQFLAQGLIKALPMLGNLDTLDMAAELPDYPNLRKELEDSLSRLGIKLHRDEGETKADFKKRIIKTYSQLLKTPLTAEALKTLGINSNKYKDEINFKEQIKDTLQLLEVLEGSLHPSVLNRLGIDLYRYEGETEADFKQRIEDSYFEMRATQELMKLLLPEGSKDLVLPTVAQESVFGMVNYIVRSQIEGFTNRDNRVMWAINFFGAVDGDETDLATLTDAMKNKEGLAVHEKTCRKVFKKRLYSYAMKTAAAMIPESWPGPFKWLAQGILKAITWLTLKCGVANQVWNLISSTDTDEKLRRLIWKLITEAKTYTPSVKDSKDVTEELGNVFTKAFDDLGILSNFLNKQIGPSIAGMFAYEKDLKSALEKLQKTEDKSTADIEWDRKIHDLYNDPAFQKKAKSFLDLVLTDKITTNRPQNKGEVAKFDITDYGYKFYETMFGKIEDPKAFNSVNIATHYQACLLYAHRTMSKKSVSKLTRIRKSNENDCKNDVEKDFLAFFKESIKDVKKTLADSPVEQGYFTIFSF